MFNRKPTTSPFEATSCEPRNSDRTSVPRRLASASVATLAAFALSSIGYSAATGDSAAEWAADDRSELVVDDSRWRDGDSSLRWDFEPGGTLTHARDDALTEALETRTGGVQMWLYSETLLDGRLEVETGRYRFPVHLGFTGWRAVWVMFSEDAEELDEEVVEGFRITAPEAAGTLWIDVVGFGDVPWFRMGDALTPYTNPRRSIGAGGDRWRTAEDWHVWGEENAPAPERGPTPEELADFEAIAERYENYMFARMDDPRHPVRQRLKGVDAYIESGHRAFEALGLERRDENVVTAGSPRLSAGASTTRTTRTAAATNTVTTAPTAYCRFSAGSIR